MCLAIPGRVEAIEARTQTASVDVLGIRRKVSIDLLVDEGLSVGDWVLIHVGFAMSKISAEHAEEQLRILASLDEINEAQAEAEGYGQPPNSGNSR